jgi:hypothetical protein
MEGRSYRNQSRALLPIYYALVGERAELSNKELRVFADGGIRTHIPG